MFLLMNDIIVSPEKVMEFHNPTMHFPLFVLSSVLLEVKQKLKHGGVDKCHICMGSFGVLDHICKV